LCLLANLGVERTRLGGLGGEGFPLAAPRMTYSREPSRSYILGGAPIVPRPSPRLTPRWNLDLENWRLSTDKYRLYS
jgi:hypothetical protein